MFYRPIVGFLFGLVVGSFLNVVISRYGTRDSPLRGRSRCPECKTDLSVWELIPVVSFFLLRGRCRTCRAPISRRYPLIELISGVGTALIVSSLPDPKILLNYLLIFWASIVIVTIDLRLMIIPDQATALIAFMAFLIHWSNHDLILSQIIFGLVGGGGIPLLIVAATRGRGMGWGDVKLGAALGILLGWPLILIGWFVAIMIGALVGTLLVGFRRTSMKAAIPFGPFLILGGLLAMLWGEQILTWYLGYGSF